MRFSLKTLTVLVLYSALGINLVAVLQRSRDSMVRTELLRAETGQVKATIAASQWRIHQRQDAARNWKSLLEERSAVEAQIQAIFDSLVPQESVIDQKADQVSLREVPLVYDSPNFRKQWMVQVPDGRMLCVRIELADRQRKLIETTPDFALLEPISAPLPAGLHRLEFAATGSDQEQPIEFSMKIDEQEVARFQSLHKKLSGWSYSLFEFDEQRDYPAGTEFPVMMSYRPSPGDTFIRMRLVEAQGK